MEKLYPLRKQDVEPAGQVLTEAFQGDPVFDAIFAEAAPEQRQAFFTTPVQYTLKYGQACASSSQLEGFAGWVPGKYAKMTVPRLIFSGAFFTGMKMGPEISQKLATIFNPIDQARKEFMHGRDYLYLVIIGVAPQHQGHGFGRQLLNALIAESEQAGLPIFLETETEENVSIYEHFGFKAIEKAILPLINLPMWEMLREPGA
jgi:ribosomal protein S18 acetylase RimI-like enzyme